MGLNFKVSYKLQMRGLDMLHSSRSARNVMLCFPIQSKTLNKNVPIFKAMLSDEEVLNNENRAHKHFLLVPSEVRIVGILLKGR